MIYGARWTGERPQLARAGVVLPAPARTASVKGLADYVADQGQTSKCVGEAFAGALRIAMRDVGARFSEDDIYAGARVRERIRVTDAIPDAGSNPADAVDSLVAVGVTARSARDDDPAQINRVRTWSENEAACLLSPDAFLSIEPGDTETVDRVLTAGFAVVYWGDVDAAYENLAADAVWSMSGQSLGGHARVLVGFDGAAYDDWNSWGTGWAAGGFGRIDRRYVASGACGLCGVLAGPAGWT